MKTQRFIRILSGAIPAGLVILGGQLLAAVKVDHTQVPVLAAAAESDEGDATAEEPKADRKTRKEVVIKTIEPGVKLHGLHEKAAWLGLSTEEAPEALTAQLGLDPGIGLVISYVTPDSPAAKAGLKKNDLLVEFEGQALSVPAQLRRLVQARKEGDEVKLGYYRSGKEQTTTATLGKGHGGLELMVDDKHFEFDLQGLRDGLRDLPIHGVLREQMEALRESMGNLKIDQKKLQGELRRSLEEARRALERALKDSSDEAKAAIGSAEKSLKEIERTEVLVDKNPSVTVRSSGKSVKTLVKSDESGTIALVWNPRPHLTAHDKEGKLLFKGEIATDEQRDKVPRDLWERIEPMLDQAEKKIEE
jgi:membrane-associated protease RseP (regulator of RpoE activity)